MSTIILDGSYGEGGGQILRSALSLSVLTGRAFEIVNIRAGRPNPGLAPQHLVSVEAAAAVSGAEVEGAQRGSQRLFFKPGAVRPGDYRFATGTAGSVMLVFHSVFPPLATAASPSTVAISGGTHVPWSPVYEHVEHVFLPAVSPLGMKASLQLKSAGYYPRGGGEIVARITPGGSSQKKVVLNGRGALLRVWGVVGISNLPTSIGERMRSQALSALADHSIKADIDIVQRPSPGQGVYIFLCAEYSEARAGFSALGERGKRAEDVAREAVQAFLAHHYSKGAVEPHLADQVLLPFAAVCEEALYTVSAVTEHLRTNAWVVEQFVPVRVEIHGEPGHPGQVTCRRL